MAVRIVHHYIGNSSDSWEEKAQQIFPPLLLPGFVCIYMLFCFPFFIFLFRIFFNFSFKFFFKFFFLKTKSGLFLKNLSFLDFLFEFFFGGGHVLCNSFSNHPFLHGVIHFFGRPGRPRPQSPICCTILETASSVLLSTLCPQWQRKCTIVLQGFLF